MENRFLFIGSKKLGLNALKEAYSISPTSLISVITIDDQNDSRSEYKEFQSFCNNNLISLCTITKNSQLEKYIDSYKPDLCLVVGWYWIISESLLNKVDKGFIGIHASLLPQYRGGAPLVWAMINGEKETGVSMFYFDNGMDTGDLISQEKFSIHKNEQISDVLNKAENAAISLIKKNFLQLLRDESKRIKQNDYLISYCSIRKPDFGQINWNMNAECLLNFINAQSRPYPGAFCIDEYERKIIIWKVRVFEYKYYGIPGIVNQFIDGKPVVTCGKDEAIVIEEIEIDSKTYNTPRDSVKFGLKLFRK